MEKVLRVDAVGARHGGSAEQAASAATGAPASREARAREATSWSFLFHLARVPYAILVLVGLGLLLPGQMRDMLAAIAYPPEPRPILALAASLAFFAFTCWYWARAAIAAHFELPDDKDWSDLLKEGSGGPGGRSFHHPLRWVAYGPIYISVLLGFLLWLRGRSWIILAITVLVLGPLFLFVVTRRRGWLKRWCVRRTVPATREEGRFAHLIRYAPMGRGWALASLGLSLVWLAASTAVSLLPAPPAGDRRDLLWTFFLGASPVLLGCGMMVAPLTVLVFWADKWKPSWSVFGGRIGLRSPPTLTTLVALSLLLPWFFEAHQVRVTGEAPPPRQPLYDHWAKWQEACPGKTPIIVAISGGASRAGLWGAAVLARVDAYARERDAAVYAVSSVSGGSLGAAAYLSALAGNSKDAPPGTRCWLPAGSDQAFQDYAMHLGRADAIGPLLAGYVFSDVPRAFAGWPAAGLGLDLRGGDRAAGIERAFEANASDAAKLVAGRLNTVGFGEPFLYRPA